jgi:hypothetical protein
MGRACSTHGIDDKFLSGNLSVKTTSVILSEIQKNIGINVIHIVSEGVYWIYVAHNRVE